MGLWRESLNFSNPLVLTYHIQFNINTQRHTQTGKIFFLITKFQPYVLIFIPKHNLK